MGKNLRIQSQLRLYLQWPVLLSVFVMAANLVAGALSPRAGLAMSGFTLLYIMIAMWLFLYRRKKLLNGMVEVSAQYGRRSSFWIIWRCPTPLRTRRGVFCG